MNMLISVTSLRRVWGVNPDGVLHVGAHEGEELDSYTKNGWLPITWVEAQPTKIEFLMEKLPKDSNFIIQAAVWDKPGEKLMLKITNNTESTSLLELDKHSTRHPEIFVESTHEVTTSTLDNLRFPTKVNYLSLDIQGSELKALQGFEFGISNIDWIYTEVNKEALYKGCAIVDDLDVFLEKHGFKREITIWTFFGWGDAVYFRRGKLSPLRRLIGKVWIWIPQASSIYYSAKHIIKMRLIKTFSQKS